MIHKIKALYDEGRGSSLHAIAQALGNRTPDAVYHPGEDGGASIVDRFGGTPEPSATVSGGVGEGLAPTLSTLIHPLPTRRRTSAGTGSGRLRRNNRLFILTGSAPLPAEGPPNLGQRQTAAIEEGGPA